MTISDQLHSATMEIKRLRDEIESLKAERDRLREGIKKWYDYVPKHNPLVDDMVVLQFGLGKLLMGKD